MTKSRENTRVVLTQDDGSGLFSPFPRWDDHRGKIYHIAGHEVVIGEENEVRIPAELMQEICEEYGVHRADGRYAVAIQNRRFSKEYDKTHEFDVGGVPIYNDAIKEYLENDENEAFIPNSVTRKPDKMLHMRDDNEGYAMKYVEEE